MRLWIAQSLLLAGCAAPVARPVASSPPVPVEVQILALNDVHGNLQPSEIAPGKMQGGVATLGATVARVRQANSITVAAGDLIGASPLESAYFLDEPTVEALGLVGLSLASVGNHEFDKGVRELSRMQTGGCAKYTHRQPCALEPFKGAGFRYLAANVRGADGATLFAPTAIRQLGPVRLGFIGMTLKETATLVTPSGVAGVRFEDEVATANALVPGLKAAGADAIVLLIHQGGRVPDAYRLDNCDQLAGPILPIVEKLDPAIRVIVSGHTHHAYACQLDIGGAPRLLTAAGKNAYFVTDIRLTVDPVSRAITAARAANIPVDTGGAGQADVAALVARYVAATETARRRVVGRLSGPLARSSDALESPVADLVADAQLHATRALGAQIAFVNATGLRTGLVPAADGSITFGQIFALQPFGNGLVVKTLTGSQLKALLEQQFSRDAPVKVASLLVPSAGFAFHFDRSRPAGQRIVDMRLDGRPIAPNGRYRVAINSFLSTGGDGFDVLNQGADPVDAGVDIDALEAWLATSPRVPQPGRAKDVTGESRPAPAS